MNLAPRPSRTALIALYLAIAAQLGRTLTSDPRPDQLPWYLGLYLAYLVLFTLTLRRSPLRREWLHLYFVVQSIIVLWLLALDPNLDFQTAAFAILCYQAALLFTAPMRWIWVGILVLLTGGSPIFYHGFLAGLALSLTTIAIGFVLAAFVVVNEEIEQARTASETLLNELQETQRQLQTYAAQVDELAATEERNRLARELHDSVSQTIFSVVLNARSTQILMERHPERVKPQLEQLQELTQSALAQMRGVIAHLRPKHE
jgi:signal transduction histidine kinase